MFVFIAVISAGFSPRRESPLQSERGKDAKQVPKTGEPAKGFVRKSEKRAKRSKNPTGVFVTTF